MTEQLSKSARRRMRKKRAQGQQPAQPGQQQPEQPEGPQHGVPVTLDIPPRHMEVVEWMLNGNVTQKALDQIATIIVRQFIVSKLPDYREATNGGGSTVRRANFNPEA